MTGMLTDSILRPMRSRRGGAARTVLDGRERRLSALLSLTFLPVTFLLVTMAHAENPRADLPVAEVSAAELAAPQGASNRNLSPVELRSLMRASSDSELTALTARWAELSAGERRALQTEMLGRMSKARTAAKRQPVIRVRRQYGRRQADGSVIVRTEVLDLQPRASASEGTRRVVTFGVGFERRKRATAPQQEAATQSPSMPAATSASDAQR